MVPEDEISDGFLETLDNLIEYEEVVKENFELLEEVLHEHGNRIEVRVREDSIVQALGQTLVPDVKPDVAKDIGLNIFEFIIYGDLDSVNYLQREAESPEYVKGLVHLLSLYGTQMSSIRLARLQGDKFWSRINTDLTIRDQGDRYGMTHRLEIALDETVEFEASPPSNLNLIGYFINQQIRAMNSFGTTAGVSKSEIEQFKELANELIDTHNEHSDG
ncbi:hypothetical protein [Halocalculus aciditolerans]|uniref:Uncharacterized protein n=1 Tax=Halocalculus aciditolerans TaxID=1383812 RepID=A0A830FFK1_9EURY|nr:hypothetical protein [Halocalculus aciditolerans]GGL50435.1 hypothetical protein GCM10009039_05770 [Halocalculus aciditolerans]